MIEEYQHAESGVAGAHSKLISLLSSPPPRLLRANIDSSKGIDFCLPPSIINACHIRSICKTITVCGPKVEPQSNPS